MSDPDNAITDTSVNSPWYYHSPDSVCLFASNETTYCCTLIVTDSCEVADTGMFCVTIDFDEPPTVEVTSPPSGDTLNYLPTLAIHFLDDFDLDRGYYQIDSCTGDWTELWSYNSSSKDTTIEWTVPEVSYGEHSIYFKITDDCDKANDDTCTYYWNFTYSAPLVSIIPDSLVALCNQEYILWIHLDEKLVGIDSAFLKLSYEDSYMTPTTVLKGPVFTPPTNFFVFRYLFPDSVIITLKVISGVFDGPGLILGLIIIPGTEEVLTHLTFEYSILLDSLGQEILHSTAGAQIEITCPTSAGEDDASAQIPLTYGLSQNYPNPYNLKTRIAYQLPQPGKVSLQVYNIRGQLVRTLVDESKSAGYHTVIWDSRNENGMEVSSGIYFYRIKTGNFTDTKKMILLK
jgi:hypothetical protein